MNRQRRRRIRPGGRVPFEFSDRERTLIMEETFAPDDLTNRLRLARNRGKTPVYGFTLDELDELAGYVAAEANHAKNRQLQRELDRIFDRISGLLEAYTEEAE